MPVSPVSGNGFDCTPACPAPDNLTTNRRIVMAEHLTILCYGPILRLKEDGVTRVAGPFKCSAGIKQSIYAW
jgi:hypothetical protein